VDDIVIGGKDSTGTSIVAVYSKVSGRYAVYRTTDQVMIQFSDDDEEGVNQRAALAPLESLRAQINGLIDVLRARASTYHEMKASDYCRRVGLTLSGALQGDVPQASLNLLSIKEDLIEDRASEARARHLFYAAVATLVGILLSRVLSSNWFAGAFGRFETGISPLYWNAAAVGALGAFFSIALQIRSRQVSIDLQSWDNVADAVLRIFVGVASAVILIALLNTKAIDLMVAGNRLIDTVDGVIIAAFAAGFTERLVADFLSGFSVVGRPSAAVPMAPKPVGANERTIAEGSTTDHKLADSPPMIAGPPVVANRELAPEPDEDEPEVSAEGEDTAIDTGNLPRSLGPVG
jgi:hypothetical protein